MMRKTVKTRFTDLIFQNTYYAPEYNPSVLITKSRHSIGFKDMTADIDAHFWGISSPEKEGILEHNINFKFGRNVGTRILL